MKQVENLTIFVLDKDINLPHGSTILYFSKPGSIHHEANAIGFKCKDLLDNVHKFYQNLYQPQDWKQDILTIQERLYCGTWNLNRDGEKWFGFSSLIQSETIDEDGNYTYSFVFTAQESV
jgi:hypothetical protein